MKRSDRLAVVLSFWLPGLGQCYQRAWAKGLLLLASSWVLSERTVHELRAICGAHAAPLCLAAWLCGATAVWLWAVVDARWATRGSARPDDDRASSSPL